MNAFYRLAARWPGPDAPLKVLAASGQLGLGIPEDAFDAGIARRPDVIAADMGSIDPGPSYLGSGDMAAPEALVRSDLTRVLTAARALDVPLLIGSAGTAGSDVHLARVKEILLDIARKKGLKFTLAAIHADVPRSRVEEALKAGALTAIGGGDPTLEDLGRTTRIVGQAGMAPFRKALEGGADVVLAGRACDTAPFTVVPVMLGYPTGPAMHMAKILECTSICCDPGGRDAILGTIEGESFVLESMNPDRRATPTSVAAHALYEQSDPFEFREPEGAVRLDHARYEAVDDRRVRVSGASWEPASQPTVKIEGARRLGARAVMIAAVADPAFIAASHDILRDVEQATRGVVAGQWSLHIRRYGIGGVADWPEPPAAAPREVCLLIECVADEAARARSVLAVFRQRLLHHGFPGRVATGGNLAFPFTPAELDAGDAYTFTLYHIMKLDDWAELDALFPVSLERIGDDP